MNEPRRALQTWDLGENDPELRSLGDFMAWREALGGRPHYFRIEGEDFVFELDAAQENGAHIHTVWRDRRHDLGGDLLGEHYRAHSH